ncbi:MAG: RING finger domain-containing protein [Candidatus Hodarchaeales archaeon]
MWGNSSTTIEYCVICRQSIVTYEDEISCPKCQNTFHRSHLLEWLKVFNQCPMCQEKISPLPE